jgi:hypothetical protein
MPTDPFGITAIIGLGTAIYGGIQADKARKEAERKAAADLKELERIRKDTRYAEAPSVLNVGAARTDTANNGGFEFLRPLQLGA